MRRFFITLLCRRFFAPNHRVWWSLFFLDGFGICIWIAIHTVGCGHPPNTWRGAPAALRPGDLLESPGSYRQPCGRNSGWHACTCLSSPSHSSSTASGPRICMSSSLWAFLWIPNHPDLQALYSRWDEKRERVPLFWLLEWFITGISQDIYHGREDTRMAFLHIYRVVYSSLLC